MSAERPRIIVTASRGDAVQEYLDALWEAGAEPVRVEPGDPARTMLDEAGGVLITGGVDVDPASYRAPASPFVTRTEPERDVFEIDVLHAAREMSLPTLCICRGMQIANVAFGGTLIADIADALGETASIRHSVPAPGGRTERGLIPEHVVRIEPGTTLSRTVRTLDLTTGARHHQAVDRCAADLRVVARSDDGIVEALEARFGSPFWLAVQWHPESTRADDEGASRMLFRAFASAAREFAESEPSAADGHRERHGTLRDEGPSTSSG